MIDDKINALLAKHPNCGLSYYGDNTWWLGGITPVGVPYVLNALVELGETVVEIEAEYLSRDKGETLRKNLLAALKEYVEFLER